MIKALFGVGIVIALVAIVIVVDRSINPAETANEIITSRFPEDGESAPLGEFTKPLSGPPARWQMSTDEFIAAVNTLERLRPPPRMRQPARAVFNDAQIASMKDRLELTEQQQTNWYAVEASLREIVWDSGNNVRPRLEPNSLERFKQAAAPLLATLSAKQRSRIEALANIVGLRLTGPAR